MNKEKILKNIKEIKIKLDEIYEELNEIQIEKKTEKLDKIYEVLKDESEFEQLKNLLNSEEWPEAVLDFQIVDENSEEEKMDRAEGIVDILINEELENKKILDFGCGEGHSAKYASTQEKTTSVGYDLVKSEKSKLLWENEEENYLLTTNFEKVKEKGPYDIIMIYDVIDHCEDPINVLNQAKSLLSDNGKIYLRCHPWCGRHGGHLYREINKAFVHIIFSDEELKELGINEQEPNIKVTFPIAEYHKFIEQANLKIENEDVEYQDVEDFFVKNPIITKRLKNIINVKEKYPKHQTSQCFHDYILIKN